MVRMERLELPRLSALGPKPSASTNSATPARGPRPQLRRANPDAASLYHPSLGAQRENQQSTPTISSTDGCRHRRSSSVDPGHMTTILRWHVAGDRSAKRPPGGPHPGNPCRLPRCTGYFAITAKSNCCAAGCLECPAPYGTCGAVDDRQSIRTVPSNIRPRSAAINRRYRLEN